ncbi:hypothetical protein [Streptomyces sp. NPDC020817]|uniref:hypothetical protein n=1 Tax=Streptomyces sp. NPDC020817 TaxID=3365095 RepID=UPI00379D78E9
MTDRLPGVRLEGEIEIESVLDGDITNSGVERCRALDGLVLGPLPGARGHPYPVPARPARHQRPGDRHARIAAGQERWFRLPKG